MSSIFGFNLSALICQWKTISSLPGACMLSVLHVGAWKPPDALDIGTLASVVMGPVCFVYN